MKKYIFLLLLILAMRADGQTFTSGYVFTDGETNVTAAKVNSMISGMTVSDIPGTALANTTIPTGKIANNAITSAKVLDGTLVTEDVLSRGFSGSVLATNSISEIELNTNITTRAGQWDLTLTRFTANSITNTAVLGTILGGSASDSGMVVKLNSSGLINNSMISMPSVLSTNRFSASSGSADTWTAIGSLTTTITNGAVVVTGRATAPVGNAGTIWLRVRDSDMTISATSGGVGVGPGGGTAPSLNVSMVDSLSTAAKTYVIEIADQTGGLTWIANAATGVRGVDTITNNLGMTIMQYGK